MFYLITEEDGLEKNDAILVNTKLLKILETAMNKNASKIVVKFRFSSENVMNLNFNKDTALNVNQIIDNIVNLPEVSYNNLLIGLTDYQNVQNLNSQQFYLHKFSKIMVNLDSLSIAYMNKTSSYVIVSGKTLEVYEKVPDIYQMIQNKIIS